MRQVILYIAMSLDGYIAGPEDNLDFLTQVERPNEDYGYADFLHNIDTVIWGRRTYEKIFSFLPAYLHKDKNVYVLSRTRTGKEGHVAFYGGDLKDLITKFKQQPGQHIYCDGGAEVVSALLQEKLLDRLVISVIPHLLGSGIRLFKEGRPEQGLTLSKSLTFPSGLVQLWYTCHPDTRHY